VEGRLARTQHERNETNAYQQALKLLGIHGHPSLREQGVGSSNLPAPTNKINHLADQPEHRVGGNVGELEPTRERRAFWERTRSTRVR
jgi:hypothetical protein